MCGSSSILRCAKASCSPRVLAAVTSLVRCGISFVWYVAEAEIQFGIHDQNIKIVNWGNALTRPDRMSARSIPTYSPRGLALLRDPLLNKGIAFSEQERDTLGLRGLLPAAVMSMQGQAERVLINLRSLPGDLENTSR